MISFYRINFIYLFIFVALVGFSWNAHANGRGASTGNCGANMTWNGKSCVYANRTTANCGPNMKWNGTSCVSSAPTSNAVTRPAGQVGCYKTMPNGSKSWSCDYCSAEAKGRNGCSVAENSKPAEKVQCGANATENAGYGQGHSTVDKACYCTYEKTDSGSVKYVNGGEACKSQEEVAKKDDDVDPDFPHARWESLCKQEGGTYDKSEKSCSCSDGRSTTTLLDVLNKSFSCKSAVASGEPEECSEFARFEEKVKQCESESAAAVKSCDAESKNANSGYDDAKAAAAILGQVQMARGQQQGSVEACMRAGVMANTMFYGLDLMKNDCNPGMEQCKSSCNSAKEFENISDKCYAEFLQRYPNYQQGADPAVDQKYSQFMSGVGQKMQSLQARLQSGSEKCEVEAPSKASELNKLMKDMNSSAVQAQKCQCQLTAGQTSCDNLYGPEYCLKNPTDTVHCPQTVAVCTPSSADYNTKTCVCMRDPKNSQCAVITGGAGGPATLAATPGYTPIGASGGNYAGKTGGSGGINLNGGLGDDAVAVSADHSGGAPGDVFGAASTGSAGGGSTPSGEDGGGAGAGEGEGSAKSGVAGLFNAIKTGMGNLLGGGSGNKAGGTGKTFGDGSKNNGNAVDPNKWRPRGVAAVGQIGGRNENLFQKVKDQYDLQYHTFLSGAK